MPNELIYYAVINNGIHDGARYTKNQKKRRSNIAAA